MNEIKTQNTVCEVDQQLLWGLFAVSSVTTFFVTQWRQEESIELMKAEKEASVLDKTIDMFWYAMKDIHKASNFQFRRQDSWIHAVLPVNLKHTMWANN